MTVRPETQAVRMARMEEHLKVASDKNEKPRRGGVSFYQFSTIRLTLVSRSSSVPLLSSSNMLSGS